MQETNILLVEDDRMIIENLTEFLKTEGFQVWSADGQEKAMKINGMMCGHCEARVKKALEAVEGVQEAVVSHEAGNAVVTLSSDVADEVLKKAVEDQDYEVVSVES